MAQQDDVFDLIHSLTRNEKRYFKVAAGQHAVGEKKNYVVLFDAYDRLKEYDPEKLVKALKGTRIAKNLSSEKSYLYKLILRTMRAFHEEKHAGMQLKELAREVIFLKEKGLFSQARKALKKAKKVAYELEEFYLLLELVDLERRLLREGDLTKVAEQLEGLIQEKEKLFSWVQNQSLYQHTYEQIFWNTRSRNRETHEATRHWLSQRLTAPFLSDESQALTFFARLNFHFIHALAHQFLGEFKVAHQHNQTIIELWESRPKLLRLYSQRYKIALSNFLVTCFQVKAWDLFPGILDKIRELPTSSVEEEGEVFQNVWYYELLYHLNTGNFSTAAELVPEIENGLQLHSNKINKARELAFYYNISVVFFVLEDWRKATQWLLRIINDPKSEHRLDIQRFARILLMLYQWENDLAEQIEYSLRSAKRYLDKRGGPTDFEKLLLDFFRKLYKTEGGTRSMELIEEVLTEVKQYESEGAGVFGLGEVLLWLGARGNGLSLVELAQGGE